MAIIFKSDGEREGVVIGFYLCGVLWLGEAPLTKETMAGAFSGTSLTERGREITIWIQSQAGQLFILGCYDNFHMECYVAT